MYSSVFAQYYSTSDLILKIIQSDCDDFLNFWLDFNEFPLPPASRNATNQKTICWNLGLGLFEGDTQYDSPASVEVQFLFFHMDVNTLYEVITFSLHHVPDKFASRRDLFSFDHLHIEVHIVYSFQSQL